MSKEFNNLEELFSENLRDLKVEPSAAVWENIRRGKRRGIVVFWKFTRIQLVAALLFIGLVSGLICYVNYEDHSATMVSAPSTDENLQHGSGNPTEMHQSTSADLSVSSNPATGVNQSAAAPVRSGSTSEIKQGGQTKKVAVRKMNRKPTGNKGSLAISDPEINETPIDLSNLHVEIPYRKTAQLRYLIYPGMMPFVYSSKRHFNKYMENTRRKQDDLPQVKPALSIELLGGPTYAFRSVSGENAAIRNASEKAALSVQTGLRLSYQFNPAWSVMAGAVMENRNERIRYTYSEEESKLAVKPVLATRFHPVLPPSVVLIQDSSYSVENREVRASFTNKYTTISLPVLLGYTFSSTGLQYRISAGPLFNLYSIQTASNFTQKGNEVILVPYEERSGVLTSIYGNIGLIAPFGSQLSGLIELGGYRNLGNRMTSESGSKQFNYGINMSAGIRYQFHSH